MNLAKSIFFCGAVLVFVADASAVTMSWSMVGDTGNAADPADGDVSTPGIQHFGAVAYPYKIAAFDVTTSQYVEFLNAKDPTGANSLGLYNSEMSNPSYAVLSFNSGNSNGNKYNAISGRGNYPVNGTNWFNAIRFANWMNNGQGNGDTEGGAYTLLGGTPTPSNSNSITRQVGATVFLPSEDEWYKAAFYNPATSSYFLYPTSSDTPPIASSPTALPNHANFLPGGPHSLTDVGAYTGTSSPYGAYDMGGNVFQWNEAFFDVSRRGFRGGNYYNNSIAMRSSITNYIDPAFGSNGFGFRLASVPEPSTLSLAVLGLIGLAAWGWRRQVVK